MESWDAGEQLVLAPPPQSAVLPEEPGPATPQAKWE